MDHLGKHESRNKAEQIQATDDIEEESIPQDIQEEIEIDIRS